VDEFDLTWKEIAMGAIGLWATAITAYVKSKLGVLDGKADKQQIDELLIKMDQRDEDARRSRQVLHAKLDANTRATHQTAVKVGRLEGRLSGKRVRDDDEDDENAS
jgi:hypothetical protein